MVEVPDRFVGIPGEVLEGLRWYLQSSEGVVTHLHYVRKEFYSPRGTNRGSAWDARPDAPDNPDRPHGNPWERCHTENYWCWYVLGVSPLLETPDAQA